MYSQLYVIAGQQAPIEPINLANSLILIFLNFENFSIIFFIASLLVSGNYKVIDDESKIKPKYLHFWDGIDSLLS